MTDKLCKNENLIRTVLIIGGILIAYVMQMAPSPMLLSLKEQYAVGDNEALLNLAVSIIYPAIIIASFAGVFLEKKLGTFHLYSITLVCLSIGVFLNFAADEYVVFLVARFLYGIGFGLGIPFIGSAIMIWYQDKQRDIMNTINGLFPFLGASIAFCVMDPLRIALNGSVSAALGVWGIVFVVVAILWLLSSKHLNGISTEKTKGSVSDITENGLAEYNVYKKILGFREIRLLCIIFMCDFFCYSYLSVVLPTMLFESANGAISEGVAGVLAAVAFPVVGIIGCLCGGVVSSKLKKRKPVIFIGQLLKLISLFVIWFLSHSVYGIIVGTIFFGFGNGFWMPAMYALPMDIKQLNASDVGGVFAFASSCGFLVGFASPILGGFLSENFISQLGIFATSHVSSVALTLLLFNVTNLISVICSLIIHEA